jgi:hypothetical protein
MSIEFPTDTSIQGTYTSFPYSITSNDGYTTSNYVNFLSSNNSNYTRNTSNILKSFIDTTNTNLTATNTNLANNYYNKTTTDTLLNAKENTLSFTSPLTRSVDTIGINLGSYSTTGTDTNYVLKTGATMTGALTNTSSTPSTFNYLNINHPSTGKLSHFPFSDNKIYIRAPVIIDSDTLSFGSRSPVNFLIYLYGADYGFGINDNTLRYNAGATASHKFYSGATNTATIDNTGIITASGFAGSGASLTNIPYSVLTGTVPFYTKTENDNLLNAKEQILTFNAPLTRTNSTIGIYLNSYPSYTVLNSCNYITNATTGLQNYYNKTETTDQSNLLNNAINTKENILTANTILLGYGSNITNIDYNKITVNPLSFTTPLSKSGTNVVSINLSAYSTTGTDTNYVLKSGSTMTEQ